MTIIIIQVGKLPWSCELEWQQLSSPSDSDQISTLEVECTVSTSKSDTGEPALGSDNWPSKKMIMHLIPKYLLAETQGSQYFIDFKSTSVLFHSQECESHVSLRNLMDNGYAGYVNFTGVSDIKVLILLYCNIQKAFLGFIPSDQVSFVKRIEGYNSQNQMFTQEIQRIQQQKKEEGRKRNLLHNWSKSSPRLVRPAWTPVFRPGSKSCCLQNS